MSINGGILLTLFLLLINEVTKNNEHIDEIFKSAISDVKNQHEIKYEAYDICSAIKENSHPLLHERALYDVHRDLFKARRKYFDAHDTLRLSNAIDNSIKERFDNIAYTLNAYVEQTGLRGKCALEKHPIDFVSEERKKLLEDIWRSRKKFYWFPWFTYDEYKSYDTNPDRQPQAIK